MEKFQVEIRNNPVLKKLFLEHAEEIGLNIISSFNDVIVNSFQVGVFHKKTITYCSSSLFYKPEQYPIISIAEFLEMDSKVKKVKLNEEYTAIVTKDNIQVGCQNFDPKAIKQLLTTWERLK
jgi:hypothetical protein